MPLSAKQLSGLLIGLSVTATVAAPAFRHKRVTSASNSGLVVAQREGGVAKAAFTFIRTLSPLLIKHSIPPSALRAALTVFILSPPVAIAIFLTASGMEKSGRAIEDF